MPKKPRNPLKTTEQRYSSKFLRNSARSLGFITKDALTQIAPNLMTTVSSGAEIARDTYQTLTRNKNSLERVNAALRNNKYSRAATDIYKNAMSDIKSGKFWNDERGFGGGDESGGFTFGDDDTGEESSSQSNQELISANQQIAASLDSVGDQIQRNGLAQIKVMKASTDAMLAASSASLFQSQQMGTEINSHLTNIENQMNAMVQFQNTNMIKFIESSLGFYEKIGAGYSSSNSPAEEKARVNKVLENGGVNVAMYKKYIKEQFKDSTIGQILENSDLIIDQMRNNPIGTTMSLMTQYLIPKTLSNAVKGIEKQFNELSSDTLLRLGDYGKNSTDTSLIGTIKRTLAQTFGLKIENRNRDLRGSNVKIERGPIPFDGETKHAITEIITKELREQTSYIKIISEHITGKDSKTLGKESNDRQSYWDWESKSYITGKSNVDKAITNKITGAIINEFERSDLGKALTSLVDNQVKEDGSADTKAQDQLKRVIDEFYIKASRKNGPIDADTLIDIIATQVGGKQRSREALIDYIRRIDNENKNAISSSRLAVIQARSAGNRAKEEVLNGDQFNILNSSFNREDIINDKFDETFDKIAFSKRKNGGKKINISNAATITDEDIEMRDAMSRSSSFVSQYLNRATNSISALRNGNVIDAIVEQIKFIGDRASIALFGTKNEEGRREGGLFSGLINTAHDFMFGDKSDLRDKAKGVFGFIKESLHKGMLGWQEAFFGKKIIDGKVETDEEFEERIKSEMSQRLPNLEKGAFGGAIIGGLLGNPFLGAAIGGATGLATRSDWFNDLLFGKEDENGERTIGGIINKRIRDWFKDNKVELGKSSIMGAVGGGIMGTMVGGPLLGAIFGASSGLLSQTGMFKRFLYGDPENGQTGLINGIVSAFNKNRKVSDEEAKKQFGKGIIGAAGGYLTASIIGNMGILGAALTPFGPIGGALAGLALSIKSQEGNIKEFLFGKDEEDINGKKFKGKAGVIGRLFGDVKVNFVDPIMTEVKSGIGTFFNHLEHHFLSPIRFLTRFAADKLGDGLGNITSAILNMATKPFKLAGKLISGISIFGRPLSSIGGSLSNMAMGALSAPGKAVKGLLSKLDPTLAGEIEMDEKLYRSRRQALKDARNRSKRHNKNARLINKLTNGRYSEDTTEAREYIRLTQPDKYEKYFGEKSKFNGGAEKNFTLDQETNRYRNARVEHMISSGSIDPSATLEERQLYYAAKMQSTMDKLYNSVIGIKENQEEENEDRQDVEDLLNASNDEYDNDIHGGFFQRMFARAKKRHRDRRIIDEHNPFDITERRSIFSKFFGGLKTGVEDVGDVVKNIITLPGSAIKAGVNAFKDRNQTGGQGKGFGGRGVIEDTFIKKLTTEPKKGFFSSLFNKKEPLPVSISAIDAPNKDLEKLSDATNAVIESNPLINKYDSDGKTVEELHEEKAKEEERTERKSFYAFVKEKLSSIGKTEEEKKFDWRSIFSKKGLLTLGIASLLPVLVTAIPKVVEGIGNIGKGIKWLGSFLGSLKNGIGDLIGNIFNKSADAGENMDLENGDSIAERISKLKDTANPFAIFDKNWDINQLSLPKLSLFTALAGKTKILPKAINGILSGIFGNYDKAAGISKGGLVNLVGSGIGGIGTLLEKGSEFIPTIPGRLKNFKLGTGEFIDDIKQIPGRLKNKIGNIKNGIGDFGRNLNYAIGGVDDKFIANNFDDLLAKLVNAGMDENEALIKLNEAMSTGSGRNLLGKGIDKVGSIVGSGKNKLGSAIGSIKNTTLENGSAFIDDIGRAGGAALSSAKEAIVTKASGLVDDVGRLGGGVAGKAGSTLKQAGGKVVTKLAEAGGSLKRMAGKVIEMCKVFFQNVLGRVFKGVGSGAAKGLNALGKGALTAGGVVGNFFNAIKEGIAKIAAKISAILSSKTVGAVVSFGLSEAGFVTMGALNGLTGAAKLFHVKVDESKGIPDTTMTLISGAFGALSQTIPGSILQICSGLYYDVSGVDIISEVATMIYNAIMKANGDEESIKALEEQKAELDKDYETYKDEQLKSQYESQKAAGIVDSKVSYDEFVQGVKDDKYQVEYDSKADYNTKTNATFADKAAKGFGKFANKFKETSVGTWIFGKKETSYKYNGYTYKKNIDTGKFDAYDAEGNRIEEASGLAEDALKNAEGVEEVVENTKSGLLGLIGNIGKGLKGLWEKIAPFAKTAFEGIGSAFLGFTDLAGFIFKGDVVGLYKYNPIKQFDKSSFLAPIAHGAMFGQKMLAFIPTIISAVAHGIGNFIGKIVDKAKPAVDAVNKNTDTFAKLAEKSDIAGIWKQDVKVDSDNPMGLVAKAVVGISKIFYTVLGIFNGTLRPIIDGISKTMSSVYEGAKKIPVVGDIIKGLETLWNGDEGGSGKGIKKNKRGGRGTLNGSTYYSQEDSSWKNMQYNLGQDDATMGDSGCGPAAFAMAGSDATGSSIIPPQLAGLAMMTGDRDSTGTNWNFGNKAARAMGINSQQVTDPSIDYIDSQVSSGLPVVLSGKTGGYGYKKKRGGRGGRGNSAFTNEGHYVYVSGKDENGNWIINDPRGPQYSGAYDPNKVAAETGSVWTLGGGYGSIRNKRRGMVSKTRGVRGGFGQGVILNIGSNYQVEIDDGNGVVRWENFGNLKPGDVVNYAEVAKTLHRSDSDALVGTYIKPGTAAINKEFTLPSAGVGRILDNAKVSKTSSGFVGIGALKQADYKQAAQVRTQINSKQDSTASDVVDSVYQNGFIQICCKDGNLFITAERYDKWYSSDNSKDYIIGSDRINGNKIVNVKLTRTGFANLLKLSLVRCKNGFIGLESKQITWAKENLEHDGDSPLTMWMGWTIEDFSTKISKKYGLKPSISSTTNGITGLTAEVGGSGNGGKWLAMVAAAKAAISSQIGYYNQSTYKDVVVNGNTYHTRADCSGFVSLCLQVAGVYESRKVDNSSNFGASNQTLTNAGFTCMKFNGWDSLEPGDIISAPGSHVEIFSRNDGETHYVYNYGSNNSAKEPGETKDKGTSHNYSYVWRPSAELTAGSWSGAKSSVNENKADKGNAKVNNTSLWEKLTSGIGNFISAFINRALSGDWSNTNYDDVFYPKEESDENDNSINSNATVGGNDVASASATSDNYTSDSNLRKITNIDEAYKVLEGLGLTSKKVNFVKKILPAVLQSKVDDKVRPSITLAQGALESGWGGSNLATKYNNLFAIKAGSSWSGATANMLTKEERNGKLQTENVSWRVYPDWNESVLDHGKLFHKSIYQPTVNATSWQEAAEKLGQSGYATSSSYGSDIKNMIETNKFYEFDNFDPSFDGEEKKGNESTTDNKTYSNIADLKKADYQQMNGGGGFGKGIHRRGGRGSNYRQHPNATINKSIYSSGSQRYDQIAIRKLNNQINKSTGGRGSGAFAFNGGINDTTTQSNYRTYVKIGNRSSMTDSQRFDKMIELLSSIAASNLSSDQKLDILKSLGSVNSGSTTNIISNGSAPLSLDTGRSVDGVDERRSAFNYQIASKIASGGIS